LGEALDLSSDRILNELINKCIQNITVRFILYNYSKTFSHMLTYAI